MTKRELIRWARVHNYPQLVLSEKDVVRPGRAAWHKLFADRTGRATVAMERIETFLARVASEKSA